MNDLVARRAEFPRSHTDLQVHLVHMIEDAIARLDGDIGVSSIDYKCCLSALPYCRLQTTYNEDGRDLGSVEMRLQSMRRLRWKTWCDIKRREEEISGMPHYCLVVVDREQTPTNLIRRPINGFDDAWQIMAFFHNEVFLESIDHDRRSQIGHQI
jgi:hypothetical protein